MKVDVTNVNSVEKRLTITISAESVESRIDKEYLKLKKKVALKGFRQGKAPISILQKYFKTQVEEDVISEIVKETYPKGLDEIKASPISQPKIENNVLEKGKDFSYTAVFEIKPEFTVKDYDGLKLEKEKSGDITDAEVEKEIEAMRSRFATMKEVSGRACKKGDFAVIDYNGTVNGKSYSDSSRENFFMEIGDNSFLTGFPEQVTGMQKGGEKEFSLAVPSDHSSKDIAGKTVEFKVVLKEIKEKVLPKVDDEFAKDLGDYADVKDLKIKLKEAACEKKRLDSEQKLKDKIFDILIEKNPFEIPKSMVENQVRSMLMNMQQMLGAQGLKLEDLGQSPEQLFEQYRQPAERQVYSALLLEAIALKEGLSANDEDFEEKYIEVAGQVNQKVDVIKTKVDKDMLLPQILEKKAIDFIISKADITEK